MQNIYITNINILIEEKQVEILIFFPEFFHEFPSLASDDI